MINMMPLDEINQVCQLFDGRSVFITGASGFIGSVLLEKLLRCYPGIKSIYIIMRTKKDQSPEERLNKSLLSSQLFDRIRELEKKGQRLFEKIKVVPGDISEANMGISKEDLDKLVSDTSLGIVFNLAASVRFNEALKSSAQLNLVAMSNMIDFCRLLPNLISLCHISTAFVNGRFYKGEEIEERMYPMEQSPYDLIEKTKSMDQETLDRLAVDYLKDWPNTYTYTKSLAEHLLALEGSDLPVAIVRPSIVVAAYKEPHEGWVDSLNGITGVVLASGIGLLKTVHIVRSYRVDIIPVDYVVNTSIAAAYYVAKTSKHNYNSNNKSARSIEYSEVRCNKEKTKSLIISNKHPIFHCTSGDVNLLPWGRLEDLVWTYSREYPSSKVMRAPGGSSRGTRFSDQIARVFHHYLPALIIDGFGKFYGNKNSLYATYTRLHAKMESLTYFSSHEYKFRSENIKLLLDFLTDEKDQRELYMDMRCLDWNEYFRYYVLGIR